MKNTVKRIMALAMAAIMVLVFTGCSHEKKAEKALSTFLDEVKSLDLTEALTLVESPEEAEDSIFDDDMKMYAEPLFGRMDYVITGSELVDENTVNVNASITNVDMNPVISEFGTLAIQYVLSAMTAESAPTEEELRAEIEELLIGCISKEGLETITNEVTVTVKNLDGSWKVALDGDFANAILGGLEEAAKNLQASLS